MKDFNRQSVVWVGSKKRVPLSKLKDGESKDLIQISRRSCGKYWFGKSYSSSGKLAFYCNRYWQLGIWDHELASYCVKDNRYGSVIVDDLDTNLKYIRRISFCLVLLNIMRKKGVIRMFSILFFRAVYSLFFRVKKILKLF